MRRNAYPAPDLQAPVERHGGYGRIPPEAWAQHDKQWRSGRSVGASIRIWIHPGKFPTAQRPIPARSASAACPASLADRESAASLAARSGVASNIAISGRITRP